LSLRRKCGKTGRVCAAVLAAVFLTLTVCIASLPPDKFFAELSPPNRVDGLIRALKIIDGTSRVEDSCPSASRSQVARALAGSVYCADISFISPSGSCTDGQGPAYDFTVPPARRAGGADTVARE
jgi:hypothetical protein